MKPLPFIFLAILAGGHLQAGDTVTAPPVPDPKQAAYENEFNKPWFEWDHMTGEWGGARTWMAEKGLTIRPYVAGFYSAQPTLPGPDDGLWGGKLETYLDWDLAKSGLWSGLSLHSQLEYRFGETYTARQGGAIFPTNYALATPERFGDVFALGALYVQQVFANTVVVQVGRFEAADLYQGTFIGGTGITKFQNMAFNAPQIDAGLVPLYTEGAFATYLHEGFPMFTAGVVDPFGQATEINDEFFPNGATIIAALSFPTQKLLTLPGSITFEGHYTTREGYSLAQDPRILVANRLFPNLNLPVSTQQGGYNFTVSGEQHFWKPNDISGAGVFWKAGFSDGELSPVATFANFGVGTYGFFPGREGDSMGLGFYYSEMSQDLKDTLDPFFQLGDEYGMEYYYRARIANWFHVTADVQVIHPAIEFADTAVILGVRAVLDL